MSLPCKTPKGAEDMRSTRLSLCLLVVGILLLELSLAGLPAFADQGGSALEPAPPPTSTGGPATADPSAGNSFQLPATEEHGTVMTPVRALLQGLGFTVTWNAKKH